MKKLILAASAILLASAPVAAQSISALAPASDEGGSGASDEVIAAAFVAGIAAIAIIGTSSGDDRPVSG